MRFKYHLLGIAAGIIVIIAVFAFSFFHEKDAGSASEPEYDIISNGYDQINKLQKAGGEIVFIGKRDGKSYFVKDGSEEEIDPGVREYDYLDGNLAYIAGEKAIGGQKEYVVYNRIKQRSYTRVVILYLHKGKPLYTASDYAVGNQRSYAVYESDVLFEEKVISVPFILGDKFAFLAYPDGSYNGRAYIWYDGSKGEVFDRITLPISYNGTIAYGAKKGNKSYLVVGTEKTELPYEEITSILDVDGEIAFVVKTYKDLVYPGGYVPQNYEEFVIFKGKEGRHFQFIKDIFALNGSLAYTGMVRGYDNSRGSYTNKASLIVGDKEIETGLEYFYFPKDAKIWTYIAKKNGREYFVVEDFVSPGFDRVQFKEISGEGIFYEGIEYDESTKVEIIDGVFYTSEEHSYYKNDELVYDAVLNGLTGNVKSVKSGSGEFASQSNRVKKKIDCYILKEAGDSLSVYHEINGKLHYVIRDDCTEYLVREK